MHAGVLSDVLTFMQARLQPLSASTDLEKLTDHTKLTDLEKLIECFYFLRALSCKNLTVQKR